MPNGVQNWTFKNVEYILKLHNFQLNHTRGSHFYFIGFYADLKRNVCVPFHKNKAIKPRTLKAIIRQSGIPKDIWLIKND